MGLPVDEATLQSWLRSQLRGIVLWREEICSQPEIDLAAVRRLEQHQQWLQQELEQLAAQTRHAGAR